MSQKILGPHRIKVADHLREIFELEKRTAAANPSFFMFHTPGELLDFYTKEHPGDSYLWNDSAGNLVGLLSVADVPKQGSLEVLSILVEPALQGQGYGKKMMLFAEEIAKNTEKRKIILVTNVKNISAIAFYKKMGYAVAKTLKNYYHDGEDRYLFEKDLQP